MIKLKESRDIVEKIYFMGLILKGIDALIEVVGGMILLVINHNLINKMINFVSFGELSEDPKDLLMNSMTDVGSKLSIGTQHSIALFLIFHGLIKLILVYLLFSKKLWAYFPAMFVLTLFIGYEVYSFTTTHSIFVLLFAIIDLMILLLAYREYKNLR